MNNDSIEDHWGRLITVGSLVKVPKYGQVGTLIGTVVKFGQHLVTVNLEERYRFQKQIKVIDHYMVRWEIEDRI
jgi:hypothetical protein